MKIQMIDYCVQKHPDPGAGLERTIVEAGAAVTIGLCLGYVFAKWLGML